jgi:hypothetical protein
MRTSRISFAVVLNLAIVPVAVAEETTQPSPATINEAVSKCVDVVHSYKGLERDEYFSKKFDAYYNPLTGRIENNAQYAGDRDPLFRFNKCMTQQGVPLR